MLLSETLRVSGQERLIILGLLLQLPRITALSFRFLTALALYSSMPLGYGDAICIPLVTRLAEIILRIILGLLLTFFVCVIVALFTIFSDTVLVSAERSDRGDRGNWKNLREGR